MNKISRCLCAVAALFALILTLLPVNVNAVQTMETFELGEIKENYPLSQGHIGTGFSFTPEESGTYAFICYVGNSTYLYQSVLEGSEYIAENEENDLDGDDADFPGVCFFEAEAGKEYTLKVTLFFILGGETYYADLRLEKATAPESISIIGKQWYAEVDDEFDLEVDFGEAWIIEESVSWESNNHAVATIDETGHLVCVGEGTAEIKAKSESNLSDAFAITVSPRKPELVIGQELEVALTSYNDMLVEFSPEESGGYAICAESDLKLSLRYSPSSIYVDNSININPGQGSSLVVYDDGDGITLYLYPYDSEKESGVAKLRAEKVPHVTDLEVISLPTKLSYIKRNLDSDSLNLEGLELQAIWSDGSVTTHNDLSVGTLIGKYPLTVDIYNTHLDTGIVYLNCCEGRASFDVTMEENPVESIEIINPLNTVIPEKSYGENLGEYYVYDETFIYDILRVKINYIDGTSATVRLDQTVDGYPINFDASSQWITPWGIDEENTVTCEYLGCEASYNVPISENTIKGIEILKTSDTEYYFGDEEYGYFTITSSGSLYHFAPDFDDLYKGLSFRVDYADGISEVVSYDQLFFQSSPHCAQEIGWYNGLPVEIFLDGLGSYGNTGNEYLCFGPETVRIAIVYGRALNEETGECQYRYSEYTTELLSYEVSQNGWVQEEGKWYYYQDGGKITGWLKLDSTWYYLDNTGVMVTGTVAIDGKQHQFNSAGVWQGEITRNGWIQENSKWYYYKNGAKVTGWLQLGSNWYYLDGSGVMVTGTVTVEGKLHKFASSGVWQGAVTQNGWIQEGGKWYYYKNGTKLTGWLQLGNNWYYLDGSGVMVTGTVTVDGKLHKFASTGVWQGAVTQNGWVQESGKWYYYKNGAKTTGWLKLGSTWYYLDNTGVMVTGTVTIDGKQHKFNNNGAWLGEVSQSGWVQEGGKWYYYKNGAKVTGWLNLSGKWYYLNGAGVMQTGWLKLGSTWYYLDASGVMVTGTHVIDGKTYQFNSSGVWIG